MFSETKLAQYLPNRVGEADKQILIAAADSGARICRRLGIDPDRIIGDMDSLADEAFLAHYPAERVERLPVDKDLTDTEAAYAWLVANGAGRITLIGGGEGRMDHLMALLNLFRRPDPPALWLTARERVFPIRGNAVIEGFPGDTVSLFPLGDEPCRMESTGLKWPLNGLEWRSGDHGISNRMTARRAEITMLSGSLLCCKPFPGS